MGFRSPFAQASGEVQEAIEQLNRAVLALEKGRDPDALPEKHSRLRSRIITQRSQLADLARELHANSVDPLKGLSCQQQLS